MLLTFRSLMLLALLPVLGGSAVPLGHEASEVTDRAATELNAVKAAVLGVVEGITEYLPVSSTGHLLVVQDLLGVGDHPETEDAADTYAITIQAGAILAVVVLYFGRLRSMLAGIAGRDPAGRHVLFALMVAFVPAGLAAFALEDTIKDRLYGVGPIIAAWAVGGVLMLVAARVLQARAPGATALESISLRTAALIGIAQIVALWPGTSRSLVTILAALFLGMTMPAALEFSFLLGLITLTAATGYEAAKNGDLLVDTYGFAEPLIGFLVAFLAAVVAIRWMVGYLNRHGIALFGWYRLGLAAVALVLVATGVL